MANLGEKSDGYAGLSDQLPHPAALLSNLIAKGAQAQAGASRAAIGKLTQSFPDVAKDPTDFHEAREPAAAAPPATCAEHIKAANEPKS